MEKNSSSKLDEFLNGDIVVISHKLRIINTNTPVACSKMPK
jgi:hypothetical protein